MSNGRSNGNNVSSKGGRPVDKYPKQRSNILPNFTFVRCELTSEQKEALVMAISDGLLHSENCLDMVDEGYKISITYDEKNHTYIATASDNRENSVNAKRCLSARGATRAVAMCALYFKHSVVLLGNWVENEQTNKSDEWGIG